jgi:hypothetical protein
MMTSSTRLHQLSLTAVALLAFVLPFEMWKPRLQMGPATFSNIEVFLVLALTITGLFWWQNKTKAKRPFPQSTLILLGWFFFSLIMSSLLTAESHTIALKATLRTASGGLLILTVFQVIRSQRDALLIIGSLISGGFLAALIGLIEFLQGSPLSWLASFRGAPTMIGPFLRLTSTFDHANQTAMFIEATLPLLLTFTWASYTNGRRRLTFFLAIITLIYLEASFLTFSRASFVTTLLIALVLTVFLWRTAVPTQKRQAYLWATMAGIVLILIPIHLLSSTTFQLRLSSEDDTNWYQATIEVPPELEASVDETLEIPVTITNEGELFWENTGANPVVLSAIWIESETNLEWDQNERYSLTKPLSPGENITLNILIQAPPQDGEYILTWDLIQEGVSWFGSKTGLSASTQVIVGDTDTAVANPTPLTFVQSRPKNAPIPGRATLWQIAFRLLLNHPFLGIGLDNFRLVYGQELGQLAWNDTIHTNNWYIETIVSAGLIGGIPFLVWLGLMVVDFWHTLRQPTVSIWQTAVAAGLIAFFIHGLLDYFLLFNPTALLFWLLVGLWFSLKNMGTSP